MPGAIFGKCGEYMKLDRDKSTFKSHRDFSSEKEIINDNLNMYINDHLRMYTSDYALI